MRAMLLAGFALICVNARGASSCSPVDLRALLGAPLHQGDSGYCFAHTSSSLIQARTGFRASPMALAAGYLLTNEAELLRTSDPMLRQKFTPAYFADWRKNRLEEPHNYDDGRILGLHGLLDTGGDEEPTILASDLMGLCAEAELPTGKDVYKKYLHEIRAYHAARVARGAPNEGAIGEVTDPDAQAKAWSFRHWVDQRCGQRVHLGAPLIADTVSLAKNLRDFRLVQRLARAADLQVGQTRIMDAVNHQLDRGNPVAIGYALADVMPDSDIDAGDQAAPRPEDHASVFAARKSIGGRCYYYLRNSFGDEKDGYAPQFKGRYENGGIWVLPEEIPSLYSAVWIR